MLIIKSQIDGVPYHVKTIFNLLLLLHSTECELRQIPKNNQAR